MDQPDCDGIGTITHSTLSSAYQTAFKQIRPSTSRKPWCGLSSALRWEWVLLFLMVVMLGAASEATQDLDQNKSGTPSKTDFLLATNDHLQLEEPGAEIGHLSSKSITIKVDATIRFAKQPPHSTNPLSHFLGKIFQKYHQARHKNKTVNSPARKTKYVGTDPLKYVHDLTSSLETGLTTLRKLIRRLSHQVSIENRTLTDYLAPPVTTVKQRPIKPNRPLITDNMMIAGKRDMLEFSKMNVNQKIMSQIPVTDFAKNNKYLVTDNNQVRKRRDVNMLYNKAACPKLTTLKSVDFAVTYHGQYVKVAPYISMGGYRQRQLFQVDDCVIGSLPRSDTSSTTISFLPELARPCSNCCYGVNHSSFRSLCEQRGSYVRAVVHFQDETEPSGWSANRQMRLIWIKNQCQCQVSLRVWDTMGG